MRVYFLALSLVTVTAVPAGPLVAISEEQQRAFGVELAAPQPAGATLTRRYPAEVAVPNRQLRVVSAPESGMLESLLVAEGERVATGQPLATLRSPQLLQVQSDYLDAVTRLNLAGTELGRDRKLFNDGIIAERRLLETRAKHQELATGADQGRQRLELAGMSKADIQALAETRSLSSTLIVRSPLDGVVLEQMVHAGQSLAAADPLYRVARLRPLWLEVHVPVDSLAGIAEGDRVILPKEGIDGRVITVGRMVHGTDQGVLVRAEVDEGSERLRPGQFVEVQLAEPTAGNGFRVPDAAVVRNAGTAYVLVARAGGFEPVPVDVVAREDRDAVIAGALVVGDRIAVSGVAAIKAAWLGAGQ